MVYLVVGQSSIMPWLANHRLANQQLCQVGQPVVGQLLVGRPGWDTQPTYMEYYGVNTPLGGGGALCDYLTHNWTLM